MVIDEAAGQLVALALLPPTWPAGLLGFLLFRVLDILKPWPLKALEHLPGGWGVMADDLAAGALAGLGAWLLLRWGG
ncbi:MAG: phosphatidylglycerophosphatase A [Syntrophobacterales bacterium]|nr:phosphatidylglycerophosphatase A [Syntrophobacterales bacterium]